MSEKLPAQADGSPASLVADALTISGKSANRMILLGDPKWVKGIIHRLHSLGIAEVGSWSKLTRTSNPGEVIKKLGRNPVLLGRLCVTI